MNTLSLFLLIGALLLGLNFTWIISNFYDSHCTLASKYIRTGDYFRARTMLETIDCPQQQRDLLFSFIMPLDSPTLKNQKVTLEYLRWLHGKQGLLNKNKLINDGYDPKLVHYLFRCSDKNLHLCWEFDQYSFETQKNILRLAPTVEEIFEFYHPDTAGLCIQYCLDRFMDQCLPVFDTLDMDGKNLFLKMAIQHNMLIETAIILQGGFEMNIETSQTLTDQEAAFLERARSLNLDDD